MSSKASYWLTSKGLASLGLIGAVIYFLFMEHREHLLAYFPFLIFLACPLMHVFMHGKSHGGHHHEKSNDQTDQDSQAKVDADTAYQKGLEDGKNQAKSTHHDERLKRD